MAIILGIDPGLHITGYGIIQQTRHKLCYLDSGCIKTKKENIYNRLKLIYSNINDIIIQFQPDCLAIEQIFVAKHISSVLKLIQARSAAIIAAVNYNLPILEYAAKQVKQAIVGTGAAKKNQVQHMVKILLQLSVKPQIDAADALAIAITHCHINNYHNN